MARTRRQMGLPGGCSQSLMVGVNGAGPSTILLSAPAMVVPNDKAYIVAFTATCVTAGTAEVSASLVIKSGSVALTDALIVSGATASAAATPAAGFEGDAAGNLTLGQQGDQLTVLWTLISGTNTAAASYLINVIWGW